MKQIIWTSALVVTGVAAWAIVSATTSSARAQSDAGRAQRGAGVAAATDDEEESEEAIRVDEVPTRALEGAKSAVSGVTFTSAEKETAHGGVRYSLHGTAGGKPVEVEVTADGTVVEVEHDDDGDDD